MSTTDPAFTDDYLLYLLAQVSAAASDSFHAELQKDGIPVTTWRILSSLYPGAKLNVGTLARKCIMKQPTLTRALDRLVEQGLVKRHHSQGDRRGVLIELTEQGRKIAAANTGKARAHEARVLQDYSAAEVDDLKARLRELLNRARSD